MGDKYTLGKVRDFELNTEDAERLARCFNSFDDSDSWPGGFTHGTPYTAEMIMERYRDFQNIRVLVAYDKDLIVGHCNIAQGELDPEAAYVGLLGVDPVYQGRGYGKALLIESIETAARLGFRRLDLHTWGGNLKAMPLYKRIGFNWVPNTRVLMESYMPGIISCEMFKDFFDRYYWYDSFKREITQAPDDNKEGKIGIYKYHFQGQNGDALEVIIDREAKGICAFTITLDGEVISARVVPEDHIGFIGTGPLTFEFSLNNGTSGGINYSLTLTPSDKMLLESNRSINGTISQNESVKLDFNLRISPETTQIDRDVVSDEKVSTYVEWRLRINDREIVMHSGVIPRDTVSLICPPRLATLTPGQSKMINLGLQNNLPDRVSFDVELTAENHVEVDANQSHSLESNERTTIPIEVHARRDERLIPVKIRVFMNQDSERLLVASKTLNIAVMGLGATLVRETLDNKIAIENNHVRFLMNNSVPFCITDIMYDNLNIHLNGLALLPSLGYPFPSEGNEWERKKFDVFLVNNAEFSMIELKGESEERPGLFLTLRFKVYPNNEVLEVSASLENRGGHAYTNLGMKINGWMDIMSDKLYVPLNDRIYCISSVDWNGYRQLPKNPKYYSESWFALCDSDKSPLIGFIWEPSKIAKVSLMRTWNFPTFEYHLPDMDAGSSFEFSLAHIMITQGNWSRVRDVWARLYGGNLKMPSSSIIHSDLEVELVRVGSGDHQSELSPVLIDSAQVNDMELRVRVIHESAINGNASIEMPAGVMINGAQRLNITIPEVSINNEFVFPVRITAEKGEWFRDGGLLDIRISGRIERIPFAAVIYDSSVGLRYETSDVEGSQIMTLESGDFKIAVSPDNVGGLVRYGPVNEPSLFLDTFPKVEPFLWWDQFNSGLTPHLQAFGVWDWQTGFSKEQWQVQPISIGSWHGFESTLIAKKSPGLNGITLRLRFLLLSGTPLLLSQFIIENTSNMARECAFGFWGVPRINNKAQFITHTIYNGHPMTFLPRENQTHIPVFSDEGWAVLEEHESGTCLGIISTSRDHHNLLLSDFGIKGMICRFSQDRLLDVGESTTCSLYLAVVKEPRSVRLLKGLSGAID